jgi:hypothetical protein
MAVTYVLIARVPDAGIATFQRYEDAVLPLLAEHGGHLARRLRSPAGDVEVHLVEFAGPGGLAAYRADPRRARHAALLEASGATMELLALADVSTA